MTTEQLQAFLTLAQEKRFVTAAKRLGMSQSGLSRQVQSLERELGTKLLVRTPRGVVLTDAGERYLVSMLGADVGWVRNVQAAGGDVTLHHGRHEAVHLEDVAADRRAPVLKAYLQRAPGARAHLPIDKDAPLAAFEQLEPRFPVFRVVARNMA